MMNVCVRKHQHTRWRQFGTGCVPGANQRSVPSAKQIDVSVLIEVLLVVVGLRSDVDILRSVVSAPARGWSIQLIQTKLIGGGGQITVRSVFRPSILLIAE